MKPWFVRETETVPRLAMMKVREEKRGEVTSWIHLS